MKEISISEKAKDLFVLTQELKKEMVKVNLDMYEIARRLFQIKSDKLYRYWDAAQKYTWEMWLENSEIPITVDVADKIIRIWEEIVVKMGFKPEEICGIAYSKVYALLPYAKSRNACEKLLEKARTLSYRDMQQELRGESCIHESVLEETVVLWRCQNCHRLFTQDPRKKLEVLTAQKQEKIELMKFFKETTGLNKLDGTYKENWDYCGRCIKKFGKESIKELIKTAVDNEFWKKQLTSFKTLYRHGIKIGQSKPKEKVDFYKEETKKFKKRYGKEIGL